MARVGRGVRMCECVRGEGGVCGASVHPFFFLLLFCAFHVC